MIYEAGGGKMVKNVPVSLSQRAKLCLEEVDILKLAKWACIIEEHYSTVNERYCPMDIEWCKDQEGRLFIVQARPG
jgi:pyruvate,water dikinase